jgi:hypothetical protein
MKKEKTIKYLHRSPHHIIARQIVANAKPALKYLFKDPFGRPAT